MKIYEYDIESDRTARDYVPCDPIYLDIETTGLKKETSIIYLIGCGYYIEETYHMIQWFNDDAISEEAILRAFLDFLKDHPGTLLTFNGETFDLPFLKAHLSYNELADSILADRPSIDLFKILRGYARLFDMEKASQKAWEKFLGIQREDRYDGGRLIRVYKEYLKKHEVTQSHLLILHNKEDIEMLQKLPVLLSYRQLTEGAFSLVAMDETTFSGHEALLFKIRLQKGLPRPFSTENELGCVESEDEKTLSVIIPVKECRMKHFYDDYKNYYYLPSEDRAIHKSVGSYVEKEYREKATPDNCYINVDSVFLPIPQKDQGYGFFVNLKEMTSLPFYKKSRESKESYLDFDDLFRSGTENGLVKYYLNSYIQSIFLRKIRK